MAEALPKKRVGVYICHCGGNISDVVDVEAVRKAAEKLGDVTVARRNMFMCSSEGQALIEEDLRNDRIDSVVVASCTPSLHEPTFRGAIKRAGGSPFMLEQANIREQVSWTHTHDHAAATAKATQLTLAAGGKAALLEPLEFIRVETIPRGLVVGGGVAGLRAARDLAQRGIDVVLIEQSPFLGGRTTQLGRVYPTEEDAREMMGRLIAEVTADPRITIHTNARPIDGGGSLGDYWLKVEQVSRGCHREMTPIELAEAIAGLPADIPNEFDHGLSQRRAVWMPYEGCSPSIPAVDWEHLPDDAAEWVQGEGFDFARRVEQFEVRGATIILATGFDPYTPCKGEYGYGEHPGVVTLPQLLRMLAPDGPTGGRLEVDDRPVRDIAFLRCVGSRQVEGVNEPQPDGQVNDYCSRACCTATLHVQAELNERFADLNIYDLYQDIRTYGRGHEEYYIRASRDGVIFCLYDANKPPVVQQPEPGTRLAVRVHDQLTNGEELELDVDLLVLATGMIPHTVDELVEAFKLPRSADRFLQEVHPKLRPVELAVEGVMVAGTCQAPMTIDEAAAAGSAAAAKAANVLTKEYVELNPYVAEVDPALCRGSGDCVAECSVVEAIQLVEVETDTGTVQRAEINHTICNGCGMCVAACPHDAINIKGWTIPQFKALVAGLMTLQEGEA